MPSFAAICRLQFPAAGHPLHPSGGAKGASTGRRFTLPVLPAASSESDGRLDSRLLIPALCYFCVGSLTSGQLAGNIFMLSRNPKYNATRSGYAPPCCTLMVPAKVSYGRMTLEIRARAVLNP